RVSEARPPLRRPQRGQPQWRPQDRGRKPGSGPALVMKRVLTALVLIPSITWVVLWSEWWIFLAVLALVACLCYREYDEIAGGYGFGKPGVVGYGAGLCMLLWWDATWMLLVA